MITFSPDSDFDFSGNEFTIVGWIDLSKTYASRLEIEIQERYEYVMHKELLDVKNNKR